MKVAIVPDDRIIVINGIPLNFDYDISNDIHAVHWDGTIGEVEYKSPGKPNEKITDFGDYQYLVDSYFSEDQRIRDEEASALAAEEAEMAERAAALAAYENSWEYIRSVRNILLSECDWTQLPDVRLTAGEIGEWKQYREELRDITTSFVKPSDVDWPLPPSTTRGTD